VACLLICEGSGDYRFVEALLGQPDLFNRPTSTAGGVEAAFQQFKILLKSSEPGPIGLIVDADGHTEGRFQRFLDILKNEGYSDLPSHLKREGIVISQSGRPTVGLWVMPNNLDLGILENFALSLVAENDSLLPFVDSAIQQIPNDIRKFKDKDQAKARAFTWLAWQAEPGQSLSTAIEKGLLSRNSSQAQPFRVWFNELNPPK
jgi:hypothetical protein